MILIVHLILAVLVPFSLYLEWHIFTWMGADWGTAGFLTFLTAAICFFAILADTSGFSKKSSLSKHLEKYKNVV